MLPGEAGINVRKTARYAGKDCDPLQPFRSQLDTPWRVAADFDKYRAEFRIVDVEVVMVHVNGFVTVEVELPVDLVPGESLGLLLRHANEHDGIPHRALLTEPVGNIVLSFLMPELVNRDLLLFRQCFYGLSGPFRYLPQH